MPEFSQDITVDLSVELTNNVLNSVHVNQYEHKSREINIYVKKDGIDYPIPNNLTVNIRMHKSNGYDIYKTIGKDIGTISGNIITILVEESMTIASGRQACDIEFIDTNSNRLYSTKFYINVHKSALDDNNIKDTDDYSTVQSLVRESKEYANLSKSYAVGTDNKTRENDSTDNAKYYKEQAELNAGNALKYCENAQNYSVSASNSAESASTSAKNASNSETESKKSELNAKASENAAKESETNALNSATTATEKAGEATKSAASAGSSAAEATGANKLAQKAKDTATEKANLAETYASNAAISSDTATEKANEASISAQNAETAKNSAIEAKNDAEEAVTQAANYAKEAESFTHGGTNTRENEDTDNSKYYYEQAKSISENLSGALRPMGTMNYSLFVDTVMSTASEGDMYNISDEFTTNPNFKEGSGIKIPAGANIYKTADGMWDVLAGSPVVSVNGMRGNVNITPANIGAVNKAGDTINGTLSSSKITGTHLAGNQGGAIINSTASAGGYTMLDKLNSTNGYFTDGVYKGERVLYYTQKSTVDAGSNDVTKHVCLLNESGNSSFPGTVSASAFSGNATSSTKAIQDGDGNNIVNTYAKKTDTAIGGSILLNTDNMPTTTGWIRICKLRYSDAVLLKISKGYNYNSSDCFFVSVCTGYNSIPVITQLGGSFVGKAITKIRCVYNNEIIYVEMYASKDISKETVIINAFGNVIGQDNVTNGSVPSGYSTTELTLSYYIPIASNQNKTVTTAEKALYDGSGNFISETYLPQINGLVKGNLYWENTDWTYIPGTGITNLRDARNWGQSYLYVGTKDGAFSIAWTASDEALKKNIKKSKQEALDKIQGIDFIEYDWKDEKLGHVELGISANQLEHIIPSAVFHVKQPEGSEHAYLRNLNGQELTVYSLKAIQELYGIVLEQREIIEQLKNEKLKQIDN